ncbi:hypothetical protein ACHAWO_004261 [Cyclotella atomus]|uniref:Chitin-binding type-2 domain-containing protein n=1 Tax=Cyclotella atomus TaxID=382360 RepID=A0ABD3Q7Z8_9STRA
MSNLLLPLFLLSLLPSIQSQCQPCDITQNGWAVRPGTGCTEYINCANGVEASTNTCAAGTIFDHAITGCNWENMVTCPEDVECVTTTTTSTTTQAVTTAADSMATATNVSESNETAAVAQDYVPLKFTVTGISEDADEEVVKEEMKGILEMILFELEELEKDSGLKILDVVAWGRRLYEDTVTEDGGGRIETLLRGRGLQTDAPHEMMYNVAVMASEGVDFGPIIIDGIRTRYDSLVEDVRGWTDSQYVTTDFSFDVCAYSQMLGGYNDCASSDAAAAATSYTDDYSGSSSYTTDSSVVDSTPVASSSSAATTEEGLSTMIIIIISVVGVLLFFCICGMILFIGCRKDEGSYYDDDYTEDERLRGKRSRSYSEGESSKSTAENSGNHMVVYNEKDTGEKCYVDEGEHNSAVLPASSEIPPAMTKTSVSVYSNTGRSSHRSNNSGSKRGETGSKRGDASGYQIRSHASVSSASNYSKPKGRSDPSEYHVRDDAEDPSVYSKTRRADPSVYQTQKADPSVCNPNVRDPDDRSKFSDQLESLGSGSKRGGNKSSVRMDYSVVSELSEPSITVRFT